MNCLGCFLQYTTCTTTLRSSTPTRHHSLPVGILLISVCGKTGRDDIIIELNLRGKAKQSNIVVDATGIIVCSLDDSFNLDTLSNVVLAKSYNKICSISNTMHSRHSVTLV